MRFLKFLALGLAGVVLVAGAAVAALSLGGAPLIRALIEHQGSTFFGRQIRIETLTLSWGRPTRIVAEHVTVANATWGSSPIMLGIGHLEVEIEPAALLTLKLTMPQLVLDKASLILETSADGKKNWAPFAAVASGGAQHPHIARLTISNGTFRYHNGETGAETNVAASGLVAEALDGRSPIHVSAKGTFQGDPFALEGEVGAIAQLQGTAGPYPVKLKGSLGANDVAIDGMIDDPLAKQGLDVRVDLNGQDIQDVLATLGVPIPKMPIYRLRAQLHRDDQVWRLDDLTGRVGASLLAGSILVDAGPEVPYIRADLTSSFLDLADLKGLYGGEPSGPPSSRAEENRTSAAAGKKSGPVIPEVRLPVAELRGFNADFSLEASKVKPTAGLPFEHFTLGASVKDGTLRLKPVRLAVARGELAADLEYRSRGMSPQFLGNIAVHHIDLAKLLAPAAVSNSLKKIAGIVGGTATLHSEGTSQRQLLSGLGGEIALFIAGGRLGQIMGSAFESNLAEALGLVAKKDEPPHRVNCLIGRFNIASGVATAKTLLLDTTDSIVVGKGNIDIGRETLSLDVKPYPKKGSKRRIGVPFAIRGSFAGPQVDVGKVGLIKRLGAAVGLVDETPPGALSQLDAGVGEKNSCSDVFRRGAPVGQGSSGPR